MLFLLSIGTIRTNGILLLWFIVLLFDCSQLELNEQKKAKSNHYPKFTYVHISLYLRVLSLNIFINQGKSCLYIFIYVFVLLFFFFSLSFLPEFSNTQSGTFFSKHGRRECFPADFIHRRHGFHQRGIYSRQTK